MPEPLRLSEEVRHQLSVLPVDCSTASKLRDDHSTSDPRAFSSSAISPLGWNDSPNHTRNT